MTSTIVGLICGALVLAFLFRWRACDTMVHFGMAQVLPSVMIPGSKSKRTATVMISRRADGADTRIECRISRSNLKLIAAMGIYQSFNVAVFQRLFSRPRIVALALWTG
jgi:hypothetical protein